MRGTIAPTQVSCPHRMVVIARKAFPPALIGSTVDDEIDACSVRALVGFLNPRRSPVAPARP